MFCRWQNQGDVLLRVIYRTPFRGLCADGGAAVADTYLDGRPADDPVDIPNQFPGFPGNKDGAHVHEPPRVCVEALTLRNLDLVGQRNGHLVGGTIIRGVSDDNSGRSRHRDGAIITVCPELTRDSNVDMVPRTMTLLEGQSNRKSHRLVGGELQGTV